MHGNPNFFIQTLPILPKNVLSRENSSYHRSGINKDMGNFLYIDHNGEAVLFDAMGPGCICSIFSTKILEDTSIHFYFDGSETPRYSMPLQAFFSGTHPHFPEPAVSYKKLGYYLGEDSKGGNCILPIYFNKALKITATGDIDFFYHILWEQYPAGTPLFDFPNQEDQEKSNDLWMYQETQDELGLEKSNSMDLAPGKKEAFYKVDGSACISSITIEAACVESLLKDVTLCIRWDDLLYDSVHVPLGHFFAVPYKPVEFDTPILTVKPLDNDQIRLTCRWPMPYWKSASLSLLNMGVMTIPNIRTHVETSEQTYAAEECGYFTAHYHAGTTEHGKDWILFQSQGWGKYVGTIQTMLGEHYCEGDEHFYLDEACTPQINGTGTEDYYLFCFWPSPQYCTPYNGSTTDVYQQGGGFYDNSYRYPSTYYRFHLESPISFYSSIDARIQHGSMSHIHSQYSSVAICYLQKNPALKLSDHLNVSNDTAREMHSYLATNPTSAIVESSFIGNDIEVRQRLSGYEHAGGEIDFVISIERDNRGVLVRRRIDQYHGRQMAEVYVDGQYAGIWYDANENQIHRWHDSDFLLPPELCLGKQKLQIQLRIIPCGESLFTEFNYRVYSFVKPASALFPTRQTILGEYLHYAE
jgi:hypothetical protein